MAADSSAYVRSNLVYVPGNPDFTGGAGPSPDPTIVLALQPAEPLFNVSPQVSNPRVAASCYFGDVNQWFLNNIWVTPDPLDFGAITSTTLKDVNIFNTWRYFTRTFSAVDLSALGAGVTVNDNPPPFSLPFLGSRDVELAADVAGPSSFDDNIEWTFDTGVQATRALGIRVLLFLFRPDVPVTEELAWATDIMKSRQGNEQRMALRDAPRQRIKYKYRFEDSDPDSSHIRNLLLANQAFLFSVPAWYEQQTITGTYLAGVDTITIPDTSWSDFRVGFAVLIQQPDGTSFDSQILAITATTLQFVSGIPANIQEGALVVPLRVCNLLGSPAFNDYKETLQETSLTFETTINVDIGALDGSFTTLNGIAVLNNENVMDSGTASSSQTVEFAEMNPQPGDRFRKDREILADVTRRKGVDVYSLSELATWRTFLHYLRGSWLAFYLPTFRRDLNLQSAYDLNSPVLVVDPVGATGLGNIEPRTKLFMRLDDGREFLLEIFSVVDNGTNETVTLDAAPQGGSEVIPADQVRISWMPLVRIDGDVATITHQFVGDAQIRFSVREIQL